VAHWIASFPVLTIHNGLIGFAAISVILGFFILFRRKWKQSTAILLLIILTLTWLQRWPAGSWQVAQCDVGQGDSLVINLQDHRAVVIDVGPDPTAEDKCLRQLGITEVPLLILSHFHADHVGGLSGLLKGRKVSQVWISNNREPQTESKFALTALEDSQIITVQKGLIAQIAQVKIEVLWPEANLRNFEELPGEGSTINNSSIAVLASTSDWSLFAAGDLEPPAQHELINRVGAVDMYKVCHHGSKYQDEGLMRALSAQIALISVGVGNPYGHPAPESIDSLTRLGTQVLRTDRDGAIAITATAHHLRVRKSKGRIKLFYWS
jgi:competence protein ComEC